MSKRTFLFQINVTRDCNLRCTHCYISTDKKVQSQFMTETQFIDTFKQIKEFLVDNETTRKNYNLADIHVIGGEPTMLGIDFYRNTMPIIKDLMKDVSDIGIEVKLSIVTNLVTKDCLEICEFFDMVATSYEKETRFISTKGRYLDALEKMWRNNVKALSSSGMTVTVTTAVTNQVIKFGAKKLLDEYYKEMGFKQTHLGFFIPSGDGLINMSSIFPTFQATTDFMIEATDWYLEHREQDDDLYVNPIESMIQSVYDETPMDDIVCPIIPGSLDVDWDGETVTCIEAGGEVDAISLGNIFQTSIQEVLNGKAYRRERMKAIRPQSHCIGCDELLNCQSACGVLHGFWDGQGECPGFKGFIKYIRSKVNEGVKPKSALQTDKESFRAC